MNFKNLKFLPYKKLDFPLCLFGRVPIRFLYGTALVSKLTNLKERKIKENIEIVPLQVSKLVAALANSFAISEVARLRAIRSQVNLLIQAGNEVADLSATLSSRINPLFQKAIVPRHQPYFKNLAWRVSALFSISIVAFVAMLARPPVAKAASFNDAANDNWNDGATRPAVPRTSRNIGVTKLYGVVQIWSPTGRTHGALRRRIENALSGGEVHYERCK